MEDHFTDTASLMETLEQIYSLNMMKQQLLVGLHYSLHISLR